MTLRDDLERILAAVDDTADLDDLLNDEHARQRIYLAALSAVPPSEEGGTMALVLRDPDRVMAESVIVTYVDGRAGQLHTARSFAAWAATVSDAVEPHSFVARRIREWQLFRTVMDGAEFDTTALADSSNWLQRKVVEEAASAAVLTAMGEAGRTRRVRNLAKTRAGRARRDTAS